MQKGYNREVAAFLTVSGSDPFRAGVSLSALLSRFFGTERHFQKNIVPRKRSKTACFVRDAAWAAWNSVQKLNFSTLSSLKKQI